jgi:S-(hydroxymethyl)mycothiol dehydrogenase
LGVGLFATRVPVDARVVVPIPDDVPMGPAGILGCAVSTGVGAVLHTAGVRPGTAAAVVGCGGIGLSALQGTRIVHAFPRIAIDIEPRKLRWALELGATHVVDASAEDPVEAVRRITGGDGVAAAFEAVGSSRCVEDCVRMLAYDGMAVEIGLPQEQRPAAIELAGPEGLFARTGTLTVTHGGDTIPAQDLPVFARLYVEGALDLDRMVTHEVGLGDVERGFRNLEEGSSIRTVVRLDRPGGEDAA